MTNSYAGTYNGEELIIWAGEKLATNANTATAPVIGGGIRVGIGSGAIQEFLEAPNYKGWLSLTAVNGNIVTLQRQDGVTLTFDLATDTFSS